jgi:SAM-dependent methyltransferase
MRAEIMKLAKRARSRVERYVHRGDTVSCIVCGYRASKWLRDQPYGRCPSCRCASRTRVLWKYLEETFPSPRELRILHFAPELSLRDKLAAWGAASYKTCDLKADNVDLNVDIQRMPFDDESFDLVVCSHVLEHVPDHLAAMRELRRVCSARGQVLIQVPLDRAVPTREDLTDLPSAERKRLFGEIDHLRYYGHDFEGLLASAGFEVTTFEPARRVMIVDRIEYGFHPEEVLFICRRSTVPQPGHQRSV